MMVVNTLNNLLSEPAKSKDRISLDMRASAMEKSDLPIMLANLLPIVDGEMYLELLELTHITQKLSKECCKYKYFILEHWKIFNR